MMGKLFDLFFSAIIAVVVGFMFFSMAIWLPMMIRAEAKCLAAGYPESRVTWNLRSYCVSLKGTTQTAVKELP